MNSHQLTQHLNALATGLANLIRAGQVIEIDLDRARARVDVGQTTTWLPWLSQRAGTSVSWSAPSVGEQVLVLSMSGQLENGVILPALYQEAIPAPSSSDNEHLAVYADGAEISYNDADHVLKLNLPSGATTIIETNGGLTITGDTTINGNLSVKGNHQVTGNTNIGGDLTWQGNGTCGGNLAIAGVCSAAGFAGAAGGAMRGTGGMQLKGSFEVSGGDVVSDGISLKTHRHNETGDGGGTTTPPI